MPMPPRATEVMVSVPGCTLLPAGGASCRACDAPRAAAHCCVSWLARSTSDSDEPIVGSARKVTTKALVFLLKARRVAGIQPFEGAIAGIRKHVPAALRHVADGM